MAKVKCLITGASGFLGRGVVKKLDKAGNELVVLGRQQPNDQAYPYYQADITDIKALRACRDQHPDIAVVIHLAALVPKTREEDIASAMCKANIQGTINLLEVFGSGLRNFVYASTAEIYGLPSVDGLIGETTPPRPLSNYGASKLASELFCQVYSQQHSLPISMLRFSVMYGPGDRISRAIPNFINKALRGEKLEVYGGQELRDYLHINDAIEAVLLAATKPIGGAFNIGTGKGISIKETADAIIEAVNPSLSASILPRQKKAADIVLDVRKARRELGFTAQHIFPELLDEQISWHRNH